MTDITTTIENSKCLINLTLATINTAKAQIEYYDTDTTTINEYNSLIQDTIERITTCKTEILLGEQ